VAALQNVDWVILLDQITMKEVITIIRPSTYVLGKEFEDERVGEIQQHIDLVREYQGKAHPA